MNASGLSVFRIRTAETFWYIAASRDEAVELLRKDPQWEQDDGEKFEDARVEQLGDLDPITIVNGDRGNPITWMAREWCALNGRGYLCSTCY